MDSMMEMQLRIRQQAEIQREYVEDLYRWEELMRVEDQKLRAKAQAKKKIDVVRAAVRTGLCLW